jgi:biopolymer transport protein ExbB
LKIATLITVVSMLVGCNGVIDDEGELAPSDFIAEIKEANIPCILLNDDSQPKLINAIPNHKPFGVYEGTDFTFALFNSPNFNIPTFDDQNGTLDIFTNQNLVVVGFGQNAIPYTNILDALRQPLSLSQLGVFIYPLCICLFIAIFVSVERLYSLRSGLIFPRKVAKALNSGEFPNRKWKKRSAAERIVWVATKEKPSVDSLRSYSRLEIAAMERGLFLLEVVVSAAPLLGLLGTVTGLVQVFSQIPAGGGAGDPSIFSEGIAMALLTTIAGLAIAIPTLISHSYLVRLIEKRSSSLDWLTERIVDAVYPTHDIKLD